MAVITAPIDFARIMKCGDCAGGERGGDSRPDCSNKTYTGNSINYSATGSYSNNTRRNY
jgi:hypothetical protein